MIRGIRGATALATLVVGASASAVDFNFTVDAEFEQGILAGVNNDAPNGDQLQVSATGTTFPILWVANAGEDSVSKVDVNGGSDGEGCETARYRTWFGPAGQPGHVAHLNNAFAGPAPSRTAVDGDGNVFVANRWFAAAGQSRPGGVMKILNEGFVDRNGNGVVDTSTDLNGDCQITPDEMIDISDDNGNGILDEDELKDERVVFYQEVGNPNQLARSLCIAPSGNIWVGLFTGNQMYELDPDDGSVLGGPFQHSGNYGCVVDSDGILYSASLSSFMGIFDTNTKTTLGTRSLGGGTYGITINSEGIVYLACLGGACYNAYDPHPGGDDPNDPTDGSMTFVSTTTGTLGIGVDGNDDVLVGQRTIQKFDSVNNLVLSNANANTFGDGSNRGVIIDANQDIWMVNLSNDSVSKMRGSDLGLVKRLPVGNEPYTYSDATGIGFRLTNPFGTWTIVVDGGADAIWDALSFNNEPEGSVPAGTSIEVEVRVADSAGDLSDQAFQPVANNATNLGLDGNFIEVRATLRPDEDGVSPVLSDLLLSTRETGPAAVCDVNRDEVINRQDVNLIMAARGQSVPPADEALDPNGDGIVSVNDARFCVLRCDQPRCR